MEHWNTFHTPKEVSTMLNIAAGTLRKWSKAIEENNYHFSRNPQDHRIFYEQDLLMLKKLQTLVQHQHMSLNSAANIVVLSRLQRNNTEMNEETRDIINAYEDQIENLQDRLKNLQQFQDAILRSLDEQRNYFVDRLNKIEEQQREREEEFKELFNTTKEIKQFLINKKEDDSRKVNSKLKKIFGSS